MSMGKRIKQARLALKPKMTQQQLADAVGVSRPAVTQWETGETKSLIGENLLRVAKELQVSPEWLLGQPEKSSRFEHKGVDGEDRSFSNVHPGPEISRHVPLISWVQAGHWHEVCDVLPLDEVTEWIPALARVGPRAFALRIQGDSMEPKFPVGAAIVVEPDVHAKHGDYVIVRLDGTDECTFKQLVEDAGKRFLKPLNPRYPLMEITSKASVVGIARGMWLSLQS